MEERIAEGRENANRATQNFLKLIDIAGKENHMDCILKFFEVAENKTEEDLIRIRTKMEDGTEDEVKKFCLEICNEAVNRDFVSYASTGNRGNVGQNVFNALKI